VTTAVTRDRNDLWWLLLVMVTGFFIAVTAHYVQGVYQGKMYPANTFLFRPADGFVSSPAIVGVHGFGDLFATWRHAGDPSPYLEPSVFFPSNYLPFTHLLMRPFSWLPYIVVLVIFLVGTSTAVVWLLAAQLSDLALPLRLLSSGVLGLLNYPVLFMLDRGNVEAVVLLFLAAAALLARRDAWVWSAVLIGAAAAMKGYPGLFVLVLIGARRYKEAAVAVATAGGLTLLSLLTFSGGLVANIRALLDALRGFEAAGAVEAGVQHGSSLAGLASATGQLAPSLPSLGGAATLVSIVVLIVGAIAIASGRLFLWQSCAVVAGATVLVPTVAYDHRLVLLMVPLLLLLAEPAGLLRLPALLLMGLLFVPKGLPILYGEVRLSVLVNPVLLLVLMLGLSAAALRQPPGSGAQTQVQA
jgi:hypothetical protein